MNQKYLEYWALLSELVEGGASAERSPGASSREYAYQIKLFGQINFMAQFVASNSPQWFRKEKSDDA